VNQPDGQQGVATRRLAAILLAAGRSTRMKTELPKVMHEVCGRPMLAHVLDACRAAGITEFHVVVGFAKESIIDAFAGEPGIRFVEQREQKGTAHAVSMAADAFHGFTGDVVVLAADMPLLRSETISTLVNSHRAAAAAASLATTFLDNPAGYGRIVRNAAGEFERIVEHRDCTPDQLKINEVNPSYYCFDAAALFWALPRVKPNNAKGEYYITDVLEILKADGRLVRAATTVPAADATGINSRADLAEVNRLMQQRIQNALMESGVTIVDPQTTWIDARAAIGIETIIRPFSTIEGRARIGSRCIVGPYAYIADGAVIEDESHVGPGTLTALDTTASPRPPRHAAHRKAAPVVRHPPAQSGCSTGAEPC
jgi:bifunctional UDP-N-acetylglucosamine pyrophosphorylase/glucosamine-1-phosphate N-acetyltransferase